MIHHFGHSVSSQSFLGLRNLYNSHSPRLLSRAFVYIARASFDGSGGRVVFKSVQLSDRLPIESANKNITRMINLRLFLYLYNIY